MVKKGRSWRTWVTRGVGVVLLVAVLTQIDVGESVQYFRQTPPMAVLIFLAGLFGYQLTRSWRWQLLLRLQGVQVGFLWCYRVYMAGFLIGVLPPGRVGEMGRAILLKQEGHELGRSLIRVAIDRVIDVLILLAAATLVLLGRLDGIWLGIGVLSLSHGGGGVGETGPKVSEGGRLDSGTGSSADDDMEGIPSSGRAWWLRSLSVIWDEVKRLNAPGAAGVLLVGVGAWLIYSAAIFSLAQGIGVPVNLIDTVGLVSISAVVAFLPISVAGLGTREITLISLAPYFDMTAEQAVAFSGCVVLAYVVSGLTGWGCSVWTSRLMTERWTG